MYYIAGFNRIERANLDGSQIEPLVTTGVLGLIDVKYLVDGKPKGVGKIWYFNGAIVNDDLWLEEDGS
jgi:hypothetical protein